MTSGPGITQGETALDMLLSGGAKMRLWTVAPAYDGTGGTEVTGGGYAAPTVTFSPSVAGTGGQIAKAVSSSAALFANMPVASSGVPAWSLHDPSTDDLIVLVSSVTWPTSWAIADSPNIPAGSIVVPFVPA